MPKMMSAYTDKAKRDVDAGVVAAVPARNPATRTAVAAGVFAGILSPLVIAGSALFLTTAGRAVLARRSPIEQGRMFTIVIAFHPEHATFHRQRWFGRRLGPAIGSSDYSGLRYARRGMAVETFLTVAGDEWLIAGWYERDLRQAPRSLGHADALEDV